VGFTHVGMVTYTLFPSGAPKPLATSPALSNKLNHLQNPLRRAHSQRGVESLLHIVIPLSELKWC